MANRTWNVDEAQVIVIDEAVNRLDVSLVAGRLDVVAGDESSTRIEISRVRGRALELSLEGGELRLCYPSLLADGFVGAIRQMVDKASADVSISVPRGAAMQLATVSAELLAAGSEETLRATTVSGDIVIDGAEGRVRAKTVSGDVVARNVDGECDFSTVSGSITAHGAIEMVRFDSVSGDVTLDTSVPTVDVSAKTVSGDVTVRRPAGAPIFSSISTMGGTQVIDQTHGGSVESFRMEVKTTSGKVSLVDGAPLAAPAGGDEK